MTPMVPHPVTGEFSDAAGGPLTLTRLTPPARSARLLRRPRVESAVAALLDHPLATLVAPIGGGKSVALAALAAHGGWPVAWCRAQADEPPARLLRHIAAAFRPLAPLDEAAIDAALARSPAALQPALELLANELAAALDDETLLVIDDYHLADASPALRDLVERLIALQPLRLHIALSGRVEPALAALPGARLRGELCEIGPAELAFSPDDARALAALAAVEPPADLPLLVELARGWPLAVQLAIGTADWRAALGLRDPDAPPGPLDDYLAAELLPELPAELRGPLLRCAALRRLDPEACAIAIGARPGPFLAELRRRRLFLDSDPAGRLAFQPIFHAFLERRARRELADWAELNRALAGHYRRVGDQEGALHHLIAVDDPQAAPALAELAPALVAAGEPHKALDWLRRLAAQTRDDPSLLLVQASAQRQIGRFEAALAAFRRAEDGFAAAGDLDGRVRALRGQAEVYLDTVQPAPATALLKRALKLLPPQRASERAALLRLQAENWANRGRADVALLLERAAGRIEVKHWGQEPGRLPKPPVAGLQSPLPPRLLLRAGRLVEARQQIETLLWAESQAGAPTLRPGGHREPLLLLALIYAMLGNGTRALAMAQRGIVEAQASGAALTEAIAELRLGHAYQTVAPHDVALARQRYAQGLRTIAQIGVSRTRAEGFLGLALLHGHAGDLARAEADAREGLQIAASAGDEWTAALILLALGGAAVSVADPRAAGWLEQARARFARGGDSFGLALVLLWEALAALREGRAQPAEAAVDRLLGVVEERGYEDVLVSPSLFGPRDMAMLVPLLLRGRSIPARAEQAQRLLRRGFPSIAGDETVEDYHPGFTLRVQMLGSFRVRRGFQEIHAREWQREKARQLFQLLLTYRGHWIQREQICAWLWPDAEQEAAERQFKVTLNALNAALEPARPPRVAPFFIRRQGLAYSFAPSYGVWIDVDEFDLRVAGAAARDEPDFARRNAQIAVQLYRGDFLADALYDPWTSEERERLLARYLATAVGYAERLSADGDQAQAVQLCEQVLRRDRCYEEAYQLLMRAHARAGSRSQAMRSYSRCVQALRDDLGMEPLPETVALYERLRRNEPL